MKIKMYNVGFGDCFIIIDQDSDSSLLVDCGTIAFDNGYYTSFNSLVDDLTIQELNHNYNYGLITHFHEDHFRGFREIANKNLQLFDAIYVPYVQTSVFIESAIYLYTFLTKQANAYKTSSNILNQIECLLKIVKNENIISLYEGLHFNLGSNRFQVLWPPRNAQIEQVIDESTKVFINKLNEETAEFESFTNIKSEIMENMYQWYTLINSDEGINKTDNNGEFVNIKQKQTELLKELDKLKENKKQNNMLLNKSTQSQLSDSFAKIFLNDNNALSIVFDKKRDLLMTGDITKKIIDEGLINFNQCYGLVKAPHHGTNSHYSNALPKGCDFLISTGQHSKYGKISIKYYQHLCFSTSCTSGTQQCDILNNNQQCRNARCSNPHFIEYIVL
jgi:beta-lactamase superfamily II metal-dependent hydrolase